MGAFHSGEFEGLVVALPRTEIFYPATAQETFEALLAGFYDPEPVSGVRTQTLYWSKSGPIDFDGDLAAVWRPRRYHRGNRRDAGGLWRDGRTRRWPRPAGSVTRSKCGIRSCCNPSAAGADYGIGKQTGRLLVVQECGDDARLGRPCDFAGHGECFAALKCPPVLVAAP